MDALVPLELKHEEKIIGGRFSIRQMAFLAGGCGAGLVLGGGAWFLLRPVPALAVVIAAPLVLVPLIMGAALAFLPAGFFPFVPGPSSPDSGNPFEPPVRLDEWLLLLRVRRGRAMHLPWGTAVRDAKGGSGRFRGRVSR